MKNPSTRTASAERGQALRKQVPRSSHADWQPASNRPDPLDVLQAQDTGRLAHLIPIKYGRMLASPFAFLRGAAAIMAEDLAHTPITDLPVMLCGDAHLANFGLFASPERNLVFDVNDFDECYWGSWEWDLKRLAASVIVAGRDIGLRDQQAREIVEKLSHMYRKVMRHLDKISTLDVWYAQVDAEALSHMHDHDKKTRKLINEAIEKARSRTQKNTVAKMTVQAKGTLQIIHEPPLLVPLRTNPDLLGLTLEDVSTWWTAYRDSHPLNHQVLLARYQISDVALRVGGVGSVGTRSMIVLLAGEADDDYLLLQLKEARPSALEPYFSAQLYSHQPQRIVTGQRMMQAASDIFLGWNDNEDTQRDYYWRQFKDMKGSFDVADMDRDGFEIYAQACALVLANAHARTGNEAAIAGYVGKSENFDKAIATFAIRYADQTERDYEHLVQAVKQGRIAAETGI